MSENLEAAIAQANQQGFKLVIPSEILSYFIALVLLVLGAGIGGNLLTHGVRLVCGISEKRPREKSH